MKDLHEKAENFSLNPGDMLIDELLGTIGIIMNPEDDRHIDGYYYKSKFWKIFWMSTNEEIDSFRGYTYVEEYGLKMSIFIGIYTLYKINL